VGVAVKAMAGASTIINGASSAGGDVESTLRSTSFCTATDVMGATYAGANATGDAEVTNLLPKINITSNIVATAETIPYAGANLWNPCVRAVFVSFAVT
jgi:hypothetical protein